MSTVASRPVGTEPKVHPDYYFDESTSAKLYARNASNYSSSVNTLNFTREMLKQQYDDFTKFCNKEISRNTYILRSRFREHHRKLAPDKVTKEMVNDSDS